MLQQRIQHGVGASGTEANIMISDAIRPDELMTDLRELFKLWDSDGSGVIEGAELRGMLRDAALGDGADAIDAATQLSKTPNPQLSIRYPTPYTLLPTLHPTPYTLHPTPYTLHPTPYTLRLKPYTLNPKPYTLHPKP